MMEDTRQSSISLDDCSDLNIEIEARLDEQRINLKTALQLRPGFILSLGRPAGNTIDVFVGNVRLASAEVIGDDDALALRITEFHFEP